MPWLMLSGAIGRGLIVAWSEVLVVMPTGLSRRVELYSLFQEFCRSVGYANSTGDSLALNRATIAAVVNYTCFLSLGLIIDVFSPRLILIPIEECVLVWG